MQLAIHSIEAAGPPEARAEGHRARMVIAPVRIPEHSPFLVMAEDWFAPPLVSRPIRTGASRR